MINERLGCAKKSEKDLMISDKKEKYFKILDCVNEYSLYGLLFFLPISTAAIEIFFGFLFLSFILKKILKPDFYFAKSLPIFFLFVFIICNSISLFKSGPYLTKGLEAFFFKWLEYIMVFLIAQDVLSSRTRIRNALFIFFFAAFLTGISGMTQKFFGIEFLRHRAMVEMDGGFYGITGPFRHYNGFGGYLVVICSLTLGFLLGNLNKFQRALFSGLGILWFTCIVLTFSRGSWLGLACAVVLMCLLSRKFKVLLVVMAIMIVFVVFVPGAKSKFLMTFQGRGDTERFLVWKGTWLMITQNPFLGKGIGTFMDYFPAYVSDLSTRYAHNCFLQIWAETGVFSLLSFILFVGAILSRGIRTFIKRNDYMVLGIVCALFGFLVHSFFDVHLYSLQLAVLFWTLLGILTAQLRLTHQPS